MYGGLKKMWALVTNSQLITDCSSQISPTFSPRQKIGTMPKDRYYWVASSNQPTPGPHNIIRHVNEENMSFAMYCP